jgi:hypothetical protein
MQSWVRHGVLLDILQYSTMCVPVWAAIRQVTDPQEAAPDFPMMGKHKESCDAVKLAAVKVI